MISNQNEDSKRKSSSFSIIDSKKARLASNSPPHQVPVTLTTSSDTADNVDNFQIYTEFINSQDFKDVMDMQPSTKGLCFEDITLDKQIQSQNNKLSKQSTNISDRNSGLESSKHKFTDTKIPLEVDDKVGVTKDGGSILESYKKEVEDKLTNVRGVRSPIREMI